MGFGPKRYRFWVRVRGNHLVGGLAPEEEALRERDYHLPQLPARCPRQSPQFRRPGKIHFCGLSPLKRPSFWACPLYFLLGQSEHHLPQLPARPERHHSHHTEFVSASSWSHHRVSCVPHYRGRDYHLPRLPARPDHQFSVQDQLLGRNVKQFRGGLVFMAHRLLYRSTLGSRVSRANMADTRKSRPNYPYKTVKVMCKPVTYKTVEARFSPW